MLSDLRLTRLRSGARHWELHSEPAAEGATSFTESVTFSSWEEYVRYYSRMTKWDTMLEALAREYHVGTAPPELVEEELQRGFPLKPATPAGRPAPARTDESGAAPPSFATLQTASAPSLWVREQVARAVDRVIDEAFNTYDRIAGTNRL